MRLSVLLVTYNHERYIEKALESIRIQQLEGEVELVVADDASTDGTMALVRSWAAENPRFKLRILPSPQNVGITRNYQRAFAACEGQYVAVLEGDDYWVSPTKLQQQLEFLDSRLECDMCGSNYYVYDETAARFTVRVPHMREALIFGAPDLIADNVIGNFSTCVYRREALDRIPEAVYAETSYDWIINICIGSRALIGFLPQPLSVYRVHGRGVWSGSLPIHKLEEQRRVLPIYDRLTQGLYSEDFQKLADRLDAVISSLKAGHGRGRLSRYRSMMKAILPPVVPAVARWLLPPALGPVARRAIRALLR